MKNEGARIAKLLSKTGWTPQYDNKTNQWTATHPDTNTSLRWRKAATVQRILDEAAAALGLPPARTTSGLKRKQRAAKERAHDKAVKLSRETAHDKALHDLLVMDAAEQRTTLVSKQTLDYYHDLSLTSTYTAVAQAEKHDITGRDIQRTLRYPVGVFEGYNDCVVYVGTKCKVVVNELGYIVTVMPIK